MNIKYPDQQDIMTIGPHSPEHCIDMSMLDGLGNRHRTTADLEASVEEWMRRTEATSPPQVNPAAPESVLQEAQRIIHGPRREGYGHPKKNFEDTAEMWGVLLGVKVSPRQVAQCMIALKLCRDMKKAGRDNLVDIAGYAGCAELIDEDVV